MDYASSYAAGGTPPQGDAFGHDTAVIAPVLRAPKPNRMHWSTLVLVGGMCVCALGLLATIAGIPGKVAYDMDGAPNMNKPSSSDPMALTKSLDGNMKWIAVNSGDGQGAYVGSIKSINRSEAAIPAMVQALVSMDASVRTIDKRLGTVGETTSSMGRSMKTMARDTRASARRMEALGDDIGFLSGSMLELADSTRELTTRMAAIERKAARIADSGTGSARTTAEELNAALPDEVPMPLTDDGRPLDQAMGELARGGGGTIRGSSARVRATTSTPVAAR